MPLPEYRFEEDDERAILEELVGRAQRATEVLQLYQVLGKSPVVNQTELAKMLTDVKPGEIVEFGTGRRSGKTARLSAKMAATVKETVKRWTEQINDDMYGPHRDPPHAPPPPPKQPERCVYAHAQAIIDPEEPCAWTAELRAEYDPEALNEHTPYEEAAAIRREMDLGFDREEERLRDSWHQKLSRMVLTSWPECPLYHKPLALVVDRHHCPVQKPGDVARILAAMLVCKTCAAPRVSNA